MQQLYNKILWRVWHHSMFKTWHMTISSIAVWMIESVALSIAFELSLFVSTYFAWLEIHHGSSSFLYEFFQGRYEFNKKFTMLYTSAWCFPVVKSSCKLQLLVFLLPMLIHENKFDVSTTIWRFDTLWAFEKMNYIFIGSSNFSW